LNRAFINCILNKFMGDAYGMYAESLTESMIKKLGIKRWPLVTLFQF
jgi:ADP-ribosylglycohydrolase